MGGGLSNKSRGGANEKGLPKAHACEAGEAPRLDAQVAISGRNYVSGSEIEMAPVTSSISWNLPFKY